MPVTLLVLGKVFRRDRMKGSLLRKMPTIGASSNEKPAASRIWRIFAPLSMSGPTNIVLATVRLHDFDRSPLRSTPAPPRLKLCCSGSVPTTIVRDPSYLERPHRASLLRLGLLPTRLLSGASQRCEYSWSRPCACRESHAV